MSKAVKVSVLIYVLNDKNHIEKCIHSVINQTLQNIEILVIDGGSTDGTLEIIEEISKTDTRIQIIHSAPGVGRQFNTGLKAAKGEYIGICESDDYLLLDMYEKQYLIAHNYQLDVLRADAIHFFEDDNGKEIYFPVKLSKDDELYDHILDLTKDNRVLKLGINSFWSGLYRRDFLLKEKIFMNETKGAAYQDTSFSFLSLIKAKRAMLSHDAFYCYRLDNPNSSVNHPKKITMLNDEYCLLKKRLEEEGVFNKYKEIYLSWKINGYLGFYDSLSRELRDQYEELMYYDILRELETGEFQKSELSGREKGVADKIRQSPLALHQYLLQLYDELNWTKQRLEEIDSQKSIVIFGNGDMGRLVYQYLTYNKKNIVTYIDNNSELWEKAVADIPVISPENAVRLFPDGVYIVANITNFQSMKNQLMNLSVKEENIILCNNYGFFFKHILLKSIKNRD